MAPSDWSFLRDYPARKALICVLDWGLGHATRTSVLVRALEERGTEVVLASNGRSAAWLRSEFPHLPVRELPDYAVRYAPGPWLVPGLLGSLPRLMRAMATERRLLADWAHEGFGLVVSDNRYGCWMPQVRSVLVTHQLRPAVPGRVALVEDLAEAGIARLARGFSEVWIPDATGEETLAGALASPRRIGIFPPLRRIGILSRMDPARKEPHQEDSWDLVALVSGPEPARTRMEEALTTLLGSRPERTLLVCGRPGEALPDSKEPAGGLVKVAHLPTERLAAALSGAKRILTRCGYSTLMDLQALGRLDSRCLWCPTPGQTEQETLAREMERSGRGRVIRENRLAGAVDLLLGTGG